MPAENETRPSAVSTDVLREQITKQPADVPERWKLVPVEPTPEMREAFHESYERFEEGHDECPDSQWKAMLRAAPPASGQDHAQQPCAAQPDVSGLVEAYATLSEIAEWSSDTRSAVLRLLRSEESEVISCYDNAIADLINLIHALSAAQQGEGGDV